MAWTHSHRCACGSAADICTDDMPNLQSMVEYKCPKCDKVNRYQLNNFVEEVNPGSCPEDSIKGRPVS